MKLVHYHNPTKKNILKFYQNLSIKQTSLSPFLITKCAVPSGTSRLKTSVKYNETCLNVNWIVSKRLLSRLSIKSAIC
jgi:hypothetical protein